MNGQIEVTLPFPESQREEYWQDRFKEALSEIDHKSLGLDQNLGFEPSTPAVCRFVFEKMGLPKKAKVAFLRGDGYCALFYGQP